MWVVCKLLEAFPASRWKALIADREFIGAEWFRFLRRKGIRRTVRIRKNTVLDELSADTWFQDLRPRQFRMIAEHMEVFRERMQVVATRSPAGDLVIIATDFGVWETWKLYKLRWTIESTWSSLKDSGVDLEQTGMTDPERLERLFGLVPLAWLSCLRVGVWRHEATPPQVLSHGRRAMSVVRYGSEYLRNVLRWIPNEFAEILQILVSPFSSLRQSKTKVVGY